MAPESAGSRDQEGVGSNPGRVSPSHLQRKPDARFSKEGRKKI
jgi:hypothetical protein